MVKGDLVKESRWTPEDIYALTNGGYDVFMFYLGGVGRVMSRPYGKAERHPSWGVFPSYGGVWKWKDHASEETGTAVQLVQKMFNLGYWDAVDKIVFDFGLKTGVKRKPSVVKWEAPYMEKEYCRINFSSRPFEPKHHGFWNIADVTEAHCNRMNCWALKDAAINGKRIHIKKDEIAFAYYCPEEDACKLYFPERERDKRFRNNVSYRYLWNFSKVEACDNLILQKSPKDMIVTSIINPCVASTQSEAVKIFNQDTINRVNTIGKQTWLWYGSDPDGTTKADEIVRLTAWNKIETPQALLPEVNDTYSFVKFYNTIQPGTGLTALADFMHLKGMI